MFTQVHTEYPSIVTEIPVIAKSMPQLRLAEEHKPVVLPQVQVDTVAVAKPQVSIHHLVHRDLNIHLLSAIGFVAVCFMAGILLHRPLVMYVATGYAAGTLFTVWVARRSMFQRENAVATHP